MNSYRTAQLLALGLGLLIAGSAPRVQAAQSDTQKSGSFDFASGVAAYDAAYQKARRVIAADVKDGKFLAGQNWAQVWTRDTSYSVELACALLHPDVSKTTLLGLAQPVEGIGECWYQDKCGHFAGWPNLTDAIVGASGAWALYLVTGDRELLRPVYERTVRSLARAERDAFNPELGLFSGCASFMESNSGYPKKYAMRGDMLAKTYALSTCLLYYRGYTVAAQAAKALGEDVRPWREKAAKLKAAINARFWLPDKGYYAYFLDETGALNPRMEGLGEAFAILTGVADAGRARRILRSTPTTPWGFPCLWPQFEEWRDYKRDFAHYYHNGMIWPFVQGYWAWAASESRDLPAFTRELDALVKLSEKNDTFMELYRPEDGAPDGSPRQLWSASGFLSMIYHGLFGMDFQENGVRFAPVVPERFEQLRLGNLKYRDSELRIVVKGHGTGLRSFKVDGKPQNPFFDPAKTGPHEIEILMR
jgi:hypothetical protein